MNKKKINNLYIEAFSGLAGDMFLSALAHLANAFEDVVLLPEKLALPDAKVEVHTVEKNGISCKQISVIDLNDSSQKNENHHRDLKSILKIIDNALIPEKAKCIAKDIFNIIGEAESKIHDIPIEKIHFHEISGVDSIIDIVGCAVLIDQLAITKTFATTVCTGYGFVETQHGLLPVPAPATFEILKGVPLTKGTESGERVTPTGAAILRYLNPEFDLPTFKISKIAYGPGQKDFNTPNVLRLSLISLNKNSDNIYIIETSIDDYRGEFLGEHFQKGLFNHKAIDFYFTSIQMKKGRPGILLTCLVEKSDREELSNYILENTSSIGLRYYSVDRIKLKREIIRITTKFGHVNVKKVITPSGKERIKLENDDLIELSKRHQLPVQFIENIIIKEIINK